MTLTIKKLLENSNIAPLYDQYKSLSNKSLSRLETFSESKLSDDFSYFITNYGCSKFDSVATFTNGEKTLPVNVFYGESEAGYDIFETLDDYEDDIPKGLIPFADDIFGNLFMVSTIESESEFVYYWNHELNYCDHGELKNPIKISNSLLEFFLSIKVD